MWIETTVAVNKVFMVMEAFRNVMQGDFPPAVLFCGTIHDMVCISHATSDSGYLHARCIRRKET